MRIAFLFNYPLVDNKAWKQDLVRHLHGKHDLLVVFGRSRLLDHARAYLKRRREIDVAGRLRAGAAEERAEKTVHVLRGLGVRVERIRSVNEERCARLLAHFRPDYVVTALDHILSRRTLASAPVFLNAHYGVLPHVKGWNATEWSLLERGELSVALHRVVPEVDAGEIYLQRAVAVARHDSLEDVRSRCQAAALGMYKDFLADPDAHVAAARANEGGQTYYVMNRELKQQVVQLIRSGRLERPAAAAATVKLMATAR